MERVCEAGQNYEVRTRSRWMEKVEGRKSRRAESATKKTKRKRGKQANIQTKSSNFRRYAGANTKNPLKGEERKRKSKRKRNNVSGNAGKNKERKEGKKKHDNNLHLIHEGPIGIETLEGMKAVDL